MNRERTGASTLMRPVSSALGKTVLALLFIAVIGGFFYMETDRYLTLEALKTNRHRLLDYTQAHYLSAVFTFILLYCLQTIFSLPGAALLTLAGGFLFGSLAGTFYVNLGATSGATIAFLAARYLLRDWVETQFGRRLEVVQAGFSKNAFLYLVTLRLIPIFPFFLVNLVSGLTRISPGRFIGATSIGIIPGSFVYAYAGRQLGMVSSLQEIASPRVLLAFALLGLLALLPIAYRKLSARRGAK